MCVKYYELMCMFKKIAPHQICRVLLDTMSKFALFSASGLKVVKLIKKQTYTKTEAYKLYSRVFWIFLANVIKIDRYNFDLYRFKVGTFFETQCIMCIKLLHTYLLILLNCYSVSVAVLFYVHVRLSHILLNTVTVISSKRLSTCALETFWSLESDGFVRHRTKHEGVENETLEA